MKESNVSFSTDGSLFDVSFRTYGSLFDVASSTDHIIDATGMGVSEKMRKSQREKSIILASVEYFRKSRIVIFRIFKMMIFGDGR